MIEKILDYLLVAILFISLVLFFSLAYLYFAIVSILKWKKPTLERFDDFINEKLHDTNNYDNYEN